MDNVAMLRDIFAVVFPDLGDVQLEHPWPTPTVTTEEIASLGGWDPAQGVIEIDPDNNERTLAPGEVVQGVALQCECVRR